MYIKCYKTGVVRTIFGIILIHVRQIFLAALIYGIEVECSLQI